MSFMFGPLEGIPEPESSRNQIVHNHTNSGSSIPTLSPICLEPLVTACRMTVDGTSKMVTLPIADVQLATDEYVG